MIKRPLHNFTPMKAMLFAAGLGTRLKPFTDKHPKALAEVNGRTLLEHNIRYLQQYGIYDVVVNVHHFADQIEKVLNDNDCFGSNVVISDERDEVLETGGGLKKAAHHFKDEEAFVVMNVDVLTTLQLDKLVNAHLSSDAIATLAVMKRDSSRHLLFNDFTQLCGWCNNKTGEEKIAFESDTKEPFAFSGIQVVSPKILEMPFEGKFSIIDVYLHFAKDHIINGYDHSDDTFLDVGKPESIKKAAELFELPDYKAQQKEGRSLMNIHLFLLAITLLNLFSRQLWGFGLHAIPAILVKLALLITGVFLFFIYRKPFRKRAVYFFSYVFVIASTLLGFVFGGIGAAVVFSLGYAIFLENTGVKVKGDYGYEVRDKFRGFLGPCCAYDLYRNRFVLFQQHIASFELRSIDSATLNVTGDTAYVGAPIRRYNDNGTYLNVDTTIKIPLN